MLRQATSADFDFFYEMYMHPQVNPFLLYEMIDKKDFKPIFDDLLQQKIIFTFHQTPDSAAAGMCKIVQLAHRTAHIAYLGGVAIHPDQAGKGLGEKMMHDILEVGKQRGLRRIELSTATHNLRAIRLYEKVGFVREGILRNYTHLVSENKFIDEMLLSFLYD